MPVDLWNGALLLLLGSLLLDLRGLHSGVQVQVGLQQREAGRLEGGQVELVEVGEEELRLLLGHLRTEVRADRSRSKKYSVDADRHEQHLSVLVGIEPWPLLELGHRHPAVSVTEEEMEKILFLEKYKYHNSENILLEKYKYHN